MSTRFDQIGSAYLATSLMDVFGQDATYYPAGESSRAIRVVVNDLGQQQAGEARTATVEVELHATRGVTLDELDRGGDEIEFELEGVTRRRKIVNYTDPVGGFITLEVQ